MTLKTYRVFARREEYYCTEVEANSLQEAEEQVDELVDEIDWEPLLEGEEFQPYEVQEVEE